MYIETDALQSEDSVYSPYLTVECTEESQQLSYIDYTTQVVPLELPKMTGMVLDIKSNKLGFSNLASNLTYNSFIYEQAILGITLNITGVLSEVYMDFNYDRFEGRPTKTHPQLYVPIGSGSRLLGSAGRIGNVRFRPSTDGRLSIHRAATSGNCYMQLWVLELVNNTWVTLAKGARNCTYTDLLAVNLLGGHTYMLVCPYTPSDNYFSIAQVTTKATTPWYSYASITLSYGTDMQFGYLTDIEFLDIDEWYNGGYSWVPTLSTRYILDVQSSFLSQPNSLLSSMDANIYDNKLIHSLASEIRGNIKQAISHSYSIMADIPDNIPLILEVYFGASLDYGYSKVFMIDNSYQGFSKAYMLDMNNNIVLRSLRYPWSDTLVYHIPEYSSGNGSVLPAGYYKLVIGSRDMTEEQAILGIDPDRWNESNISINWELPTVSILSGNIPYTTYDSSLDGLVTYNNTSFTSRSLGLAMELQGNIYSTTSLLLWDILITPQVVLDISLDKFSIESLLVDVVYDSNNFISTDFWTKLTIGGFFSIDFEVQYNKYDFNAAPVSPMLLKYHKQKIESVAKGLNYDKYSSNELIFNMAYDISGRYGGFITKSYIEELPIFPTYLDGNTALWDAPMIPYLDGNSRMISEVEDIIDYKPSSKPINEIIPYDFRDVDTTSLVVSHGPAHISYNNGFIYVNNKVLNMTKKYQVIDNLQILNILPNYWVYTIQNSLVYGDFLLKPGSLTKDLNYLGTYNADTTFVLNFPYNRQFNIRSISKPLIVSLENQTGSFPWINSNSIINESDLVVMQSLTTVQPNNLRPLVNAFTVLQGDTTNLYYDGRGFYYFEILPTTPIEAEPIILLSDLLVGDITTNLALSALSPLPEKSYLNSLEVDLVDKVVLYHPAALINKPVPQVAKKLSDVYVMPSTDNFNTITLIRSEYQLVGCIIIQDNTYWCKLTWSSLNTYHIDTYNLIEDLSKVSSIRLRVVTEFNKYI